MIKIIKISERPEIWEGSVDGEERGRIVRIDNRWTLEYGDGYVKSGIDSFPLAYHLLEIKLKS